MLFLLHPVDSLLFHYTPALHSWMSDKLIQTLCCLFLIPWCLVVWNFWGNLEKKQLRWIIMLCSFKNLYQLLLLNYSPGWQPKVSHAWSFTADCTSHKRYVDFYLSLSQCETRARSEHPRYLSLCRITVLKLSPLAIYPWRMFMTGMWSTYFCTYLRTHYIHWSTDNNV